MMTNGWQIVPLAEVLKQDTNYVTELEPITYPKLSVKLYGKGVVLDTPTDGGNVKMQRHQFAKPGQIILSEIWAKKGAIGIVPKEGEGALVTSHFFLFDVVETKILREFMSLLLKRNYFAEALDSRARGTTGYAAVRPKQFLALEIPLPPLDEQRRIVERVEALATRISKAQSLREEASEEAKLLPFATARKIFANLDVQIIELGELVDQSRNGIQTGPFGAQLGSDNFIESGHPVITIGNVQFTGLETHKLKFISKEKAKQLARFVAQEGDILFARMGTVGRCCVVPKEAEGWIYNYHLIRVALDKTKAEPRYIHWLIRASEDIETKLGDKIRGATREGVNSKIVASLPCRVPPLDEQRRIVAYLDSVQARLASLREPHKGVILQSQTGEELDALLPSVLDRAFKGEL